MFRISFREYDEQSYVFVIIPHSFWLKITMINTKYYKEIYKRGTEMFISMQCTNNAVPGFMQATGWPDGTHLENEVVKMSCEEWKEGRGGNGRGMWGGEGGGREKNLSILVKQVDQGATFDKQLGDLSIAVCGGTAHERRPLGTEVGLVRVGTGV